MKSRYIFIIAPIAIVIFSLAFNHGRASIREIAAGIQSAFSLDLGNTSSCFQEILSRKSGYTNYLDKLRDKLNGRIDEIEKPAARRL